MIAVTMYRDSGGYQGFQSEGHADYAEEGYDIICAAVSALTVNAVNSIEAFTEDAYTVEQDDGYLKLTLEGSVSERTRLLLDSLALGIQGISETYGKQYIELSFREV